MDYKVCGVSDVRAVRDLAERTFRDTFGHENTPEDMDAYALSAFSVERISGEIANEHSLFVLAVEEHQEVGYLKLNYGPAQTELKDASSLEIERIYVHRDYLGSGAGQGLMAYAIQQARRDKLKYIWLGVSEQNPRAVRFYERNGFYRFGEHTFRVGDDEQVDSLMRKDIELLID